MYYFENGNSPQPVSSAEEAKKPNLGLVLGHWSEILAKPTDGYEMSCMDQCSQAILGHGRVDNHVYGHRAGCRQAPRFHSMSGSPSE